MRERLLFALIPLVSTPAPAAPVEEYSRLQTQFVNQLKETSTGIALPAQDFKRYSAVATFSDGDKSYSMIVCRILYGDMVHFLVLAKAYKSDNGNQTDTFSTNRTFRVGEDKKTIEETRSSSTANASRLDDGSVKHLLERALCAGSVLHCEIQAMVLRQPD